MFAGMKVVMDALTTSPSIRESRQMNRILGMGCAVGFARWGRIPPDSGGWHRGVDSGSVADAIHPRSLDTLTDYDMKGGFRNGTSVLLVLLSRFPQDLKFPPETYSEL